MARPPQLPKLSTLAPMPSVEMLAVRRIDATTWQLVEATVPLSECKPVGTPVSTELRAIGLLESEQEKRRFRRARKAG